jgi:hypothetical protein
LRGELEALREAQESPETVEAALVEARRRVRMNEER